MRPFEVEVLEGRQTWSRGIQQGKGLRVRQP